MKVRLDKQFINMIDHIDTFTNNYLVEMPTNFYKLKNENIKFKIINFKFLRIKNEFEEFKIKNNLNNTTLINSIFKYEKEKNEKN